jgi:single stranded DNA-binding protein
MEMASENQVTIVGNLTDDPELRYTPNGAAVVKFRVAVNRRYKDEAGNWKDGETSYFSVNAWRSLAENSAETLTRGTRVLVTGRLQMRSWETQEGTSARWWRSRPTRSARACVGRPRRSSVRAAPAATGRPPRSALPRQTRRHHWMPPKTKKRPAKREKDDKGWQKKQKRKICIFCKDKIEFVDYKDTMLLRKFVSDRGKIRARRVSGNCVQHQRDVAMAVKNAREMALLPYSTR